MLEINRVLLTARLTRDPEVRSTSSGKRVAKLELASNRKGWGGNQDEVMFIVATVWEKQAEFAANYLRKGSGVYVEGRLKMDEWQDKESGKKRTRIEIVAERLAFAESKQDGGEPSTRQKVNAAMGNGEDEARREQRARIENEPAADDQELPF